MYLNLVQITESFGVTEKVVQDWIRTEGMPHLQERGRLLFDRAQVTEWAATGGQNSQLDFCLRRSD
jgi:PTS system nitrogen regulatory IIA component